MPLYQTKEIELPGGEQVTIRELSVGQLREADRKGTEEAVRLMAMMPEKIVESQLANQRDRQMERIVRYEGYDPESLLRYGIIAWTFSEELTPENIAALGAQTGEVIARAIFELSVLSEGEAASSSTPSLKAGQSQDGPSEPIASSKSVDS